MLSPTEPIVQLGDEMADRGHAGLRTSGGRFCGSALQAVQAHGTSRNPPAYLAYGPESETGVVEIYEIVRQTKQLRHNDHENLEQLGFGVILAVYL